MSRLSYAERKALGLCSKCANPREPNRSRCRTCLNMQRDVQKARQGRCALAGICLTCARQPATHGFYCGPCRDKLDASARKHGDTPHAKQRDRLHGLRQRAERLAAGLCTRCGLAAPPRGRRLCNDCGLRNRNIQVERYHQRLADGLCPVCGHARDLSGHYCSTCLGRIYAYQRKGRAPATIRGEAA